MAPSRARGLALALSVLLSAAAAAEGLYLHSIPTAGAPAALTREGGLRVRAFVASPEDLAGRLPGMVRSVGDDHLEIDLAAYPQVEPLDPDLFRTASFLIDFDEPDLIALAQELVERHGASPDIEALRAFASGAIPTKSMDRGWDLASRVARSGTGDCTEHAVLLTALARSLERPARVVTGLAIVKVAGEVRSFGHAWTEIHENGRWTVADATPIADEADALVYLPILVLEDEGPGFAMKLGIGMQRTWVRSVEIRSGE